MSKFLPQTIDGLKQISGFGKIKAEKLGKHFLDIISKYCDEHNLHSLINDKPLKPEKKISNPQSEKTDTKTITFNLYKEGKTIQEIAEQRSLAISTIESHLFYFAGRKEIEAGKLVSEAQQQLIMQTINKFGKENLKMNTSVNVQFDVRGH